MKTNWQLDYEEGDDVHAPPEKEVFQGTLWERPGTQVNKTMRSKRGALALIPLPDNHRRKSELLRSYHRRLLSVLKDRFGQELFSIDEAVSAMSNTIDKMAIANQLALLWAKGFSEKYVAGEYNAGVYEGTGGEYHGVHYRLIK